MRARTEKISDEVESDRQPTLPLLWFMAKNAEETETGNQAERIKGMVGVTRFELATSTSRT